MTAEVASTPEISLTLTPRVTAGVASGVHVRYALRGVAASRGDVLCRLPRTAAGVACAAVDGDGVTARDDDGLLVLTHEDDEPGPMYTYRLWRTDRDTNGTVHVEYFAPVRMVTAATTNGPLFDLRAEGAGISAAGLAFLALPPYEGPLDITLTWALDALPVGARGIHNHGEGTVRRTGALRSLEWCYFMAGVIESFPALPDAEFGMYWLSQPAFDAAVIGESSRRLYRSMCELFREPDPGYRVLVRKHPFPGSGGTSFPRGFMFGWSDEPVDGAPVTVDDITKLLAHETVHNWLILDGALDEFSWYSEGLAEYYSLAVMHRSGMIDDQALLHLLNERAVGYYSNPAQTLSLTDATARFWSDWQAQRVPYGRGLMYFIDLDHKVRVTSHGKRCLDDVILDVLQRQRSGSKVTASDWPALIASELGNSAIADFEAMLAGEWIIPAAEGLGPRFVATATKIRQLDMGFDYASLRSGIVSGVREGGAAYEAGIRDGDVIIEAPSPIRLAQRPAQPTALTLQRGDHTFSVVYEPFGALIAGITWQLAAGLRAAPA